MDGHKGREAWGGGGGSCWKNRLALRRVRPADKVQMPKNVCQNLKSSVGGHRRVRARWDWRIDLGGKRNHSNSSSTHISLSSFTKERDITHH